MIYEEKKLIQTAQSKPNCSFDAAEILLHSHVIEVHAIFLEQVDGRTPDAVLVTPEFHGHCSGTWRNSANVDNRWQCSVDSSYNICVICWITFELLSKLGERKELAANEVVSCTNRRHIIRQRHYCTCDLLLTQNIYVSGMVLRDLNWAEAIWSVVALVEKQWWRSQAVDEGNIWKRR